jgi:uncharacterized protein (DUF1697 family)
MSLTHVALLRGINVGGKHKLPMKDLAALFEAAGCADVRTYIQSGNVLFKASGALAKKVPGLVSAGIRERFGFDAPVVLRSGEELRLAATANPFLKEGAEEVGLHLVFLEHEPSVEQAVSLDPNRSPGDRFVLRGREIYLHLPNGAADTKLTTAWFDSKLKTVSTGRNWRTVTTLLEWLEG